MRQQSAPLYDLFKLIVLIILLALLILMLLRPPSAGFLGMQLPGAAFAASTDAPQNTAVPAQPTTTATLPPSASATPAASFTPTTMPTTEPTAKPTTEPTVEPTPAAALTPTEPAPMPTDTSATTAQTAGQPADLEDCAALPSRLSIGTNVRVRTNLHFRSSPGIDASLIRTHYQGTIMEVIGGPQCISYQGGYYLWWEMQHPDGSTGWSAEGSISRAEYFVAPVD